ncbi:hypothetical protein HLB23_11400 [Nocardia uniformis]|uniref:3-methylfumaryl-CoA hydratase n=1 Tax=Nocardia uniformis TaxID=53432 RepID=A0A849C1Z2_9NOCA|nr:MaoC family dehydratase N-terminal domain-containing protein [Nocardia uniformis]NNH70460.1 hypothetical protein [Nocardia uniformis]
MSGLERYLTDWHPEPVIEHDEMSTREPARFAALLNQPTAPAAGSPLPLLWHWFHFLDWPAQHDIGEDGHPANHGFLPPIPDRRRMFAGGRVEITRPLDIGQPADRTSRVSDIAVKQGKTGELALITVRTEYRQAGTLRLTEEQDLVYRSGAGTHREFPMVRPEPRPSTAAWQSEPQLSTSLLFRFSALTANAHRIHYDEPYTRETEGFPALVVHGPLLVLLLLELARAHQRGRQVESIVYRLQHPVFLGNRVLLSGDMTGPATATLTATAAADTRNAVADIRFAEDPA